MNCIENSLISYTDPLQNSMLSSAHVRRHRLSIAFILLPVVGLLVSHALHAAEQNSLPELGNTAELDRLLSQEITDDYIFSESSDSYTAVKPAQTVVDSATVDQTVVVVEAVPLNAVTDAVDTGTAEKTTEQPSADKISAPTDQILNNSSTPQVFVDKSDPSDTVWQRISQSDRMPLKQHERVKFYTDQYLRESLWISKILRRGSPFLAHLVTTLDRRFMPLELALLPAIESGYLPTAKSSGSAVGLWQIVPITAKEIGVKRDAWFDGRGDILASTTAAIDYLSYLNAEFNGDWELTLAAYNAGPGRVRAAVRKNKKAGLPTDYWSLELPRETLNYVPKFMALVKLINQKDHGGFDMPDVRMEPAFESIDVGFRVSIDRAAKIADIDEDLLRSLNAGLIHGVTAPQGPHYLIIPAGSGIRFQQAFANVDKNTVFSEPKTHDVENGDTISSIALKYGITQRRLLSMNGLDNAKIRIGQKIAVIDARNIPESVVEYVVSIGDTLSEIANTFSVNMQDITQSDGKALDDDVIHPGDTLNIIVTPPTSG